MGVGDVPPDVIRPAGTPSGESGGTGSATRSAPGSMGPGASAPGTGSSTSAGGTTVTSSGTTDQPAGERLTGSSSGDGQAGAGGSDGGDAGAAPPRPGVGAQFASTRTAFAGLIRSHVDLFKAELGDILAEVKKIAILGGAIAGVALFVGNLLFVGTILFLAEWLFGSIGWGVLQGTLLGLGVIAALAFALLGAGKRPAILGFVVALVLGVVVGLVVGPLVANLLDWRVAAAVGVTVGALVWPIAQLLFARSKLDPAARFGRLKPRVTMETTLETKDWLVQQWQERRKKLARQ